MPRLISPATGNLESEPQTLILPNAGGDATTELEHSGGVRLQAGGLMVDFSNVVIHFSGSDADKVTAELSFAGAAQNMAVADITGSNSLTVDSGVRDKNTSFRGS